MDIHTHHVYCVYIYVRRCPLSFVLGAFTTLENFSWLSKKENVLGNQDIASPHRSHSRFDALRYFNHILPLCDYLIFGYSRYGHWEDSTIKYSLIEEHMVPVEQFNLSDADIFTLFRKRII